MNTLLPLPVATLTLLMFAVGLFLLPPAAPAYAQSPSGTLRGTVVDQATRSPLAGVNVVLRGTTYGASTDADGMYAIPGIPVGTYAVEFRFVGFQPYVQTDVVVRPGRTTVAQAQLRETILEGEGVTVTAGYFQSSDTEVTSVTTLSNEEIRRSPGAGQEIVRVLNALPGVAARGEASQDIMVRGGAPVENAFYIDNIFIPNTQHFATETGSSFGPTGIINTEFVERIDFSTGGFSAAFGNRLSSVGEITYRDGNPDDFTGELGFNFTGGTGILEGPLPNERGSWFMSARRSYLDVIASAIDAGGAPRFGDAQGKATLELSDAHTLTVLNLFGTSRFQQDRDDAIDEGEETFIDVINRQNTAGVNWQALLGTTGVANTSLSYSFSGREFTSRLADGDAVDFDEDLLIQYVALRNRTAYQRSPRLSLEGGLEAVHERGDFDYAQDAYLDRTGTPQPGFTRNLDLSDTRLSTFGSAIVRPVAPLQVTGGLRVDYAQLNGDTYVSPRLALAYQLTDQLALTGSAGVFRQAVPLFIVSQNPANEDLEHMRATHYIAGIEYLLTPATKVTLEVFDKEYRDMPEVVANGEAVADPVYVLDNRGDFSGELASTGRGYARGAELLVQKKLAQGFYGLASASVFRSRYRDFQGTWRDRDFDTRTLFSVIGGYKPNNRWEVSARWTYYGGRPYAPIDAERSRLENDEIIDLAQFNEERLPAFHSLYLRADRRFIFRSTSVVTYLSLWNAYNRANVEDRYWNFTDQQVDDREQFSLLPIVGVEWEF